MPIRRPTLVAGASRLRRTMQRREVHSKDEKHKRSERSLAYFGATIALIGAALGAAGAGIPALIGSSNQITAEDARSRAEFDREQRQEAYAALLQAQGRLADTHTDWRQEALRSAPSSHSRQGPLDAYDEFDQALSIVLVVGSDKAVEAASNLAEINRLWSIEELFVQETLADLSAEQAQQIRDAGPFADLIEGLQDDARRAADATNIFMEQVRSELFHSE